MAKRIDPRIYNNFVDANFWDESGDLLEDSAMARILELAERGEVQLILPYSVKVEIEHPRTPQEIKRRTAGMVYTCQTSLTPNEEAVRAELLALIQGDAKPGKHDRDVCHLFEAQKYGGGYFITKDTRLSKRRGAVERLLTSLRVVPPSEFVKYISSGGL